MEKITVKDVKKHLSTKSRIKVTGKKIFSLPKTMLSKTKQGYQNLKAKLNNFVTEEAKQEVIDKKVEKIDEKRQEQKEFIGQMEKQDEFRVGNKQYYLKVAKEELNKLNEKRIKRAKKGLGVFSLAKLTLGQIKKNTTSKIEKRKEERKEKEQKQILTDNYKRSLELQKELLELQKENREILEQSPQLNTYFNSLVNNEVINVSSVKKSTEEEKNKIKNSSKFKKAAIALSVAAGIAITSSSIGSLINSDKTNIEKPELDNNPKQIESIVDLTPLDRQQTTNIKLGSYINLNEGSKIYETSSLEGKVGMIGLNGYTDDTLFQINAISYIDENNNVTSFNLVQKNDNQKTSIINKHNEFINSTKNIRVQNFHITPCNELGIPQNLNEKDIDLGGWTNGVKSGIKVIDSKTVMQNANLQMSGKVL